MTIIRHRLFEKSFRRLPEQVKAKVYAVIRRFAVNPYDPSLRNHPLSGRMQARRSLSVTGDYRIVFEELEDGIFIVLLDVGSHEDVYF